MVHVHILYQTKTLEMDFLGSAMSNDEILGSIATLQWIHKHDSGMMEKLTAAKLAYEVYQRMSGEREVEALRNRTIAAIVKYVNDNPKAKREDLQKELAKRIVAFAQSVDKL